MSQGFTSGIPIDTDGTLSANSDFLVPSQKAVKTYVDTQDATKLDDSMNTNKLLGRGTAGSGAVEEITLGTNLSLTGTTLNAAAGGTVYSFVIASSGKVTAAAATGNQALLNVLIPGGTLAIGDTIDIPTMWRKYSGSASCPWYIKIHSATGTAGTIISQYAGTGSQSSASRPFVIITGASAQVASPPFNGITYGVAAVDTIATSLAIASDIYINFVCNKTTAGDSFDLRGASVIINKKV